MYEVELKLRVAPKHFQGISTELLGMSFEETEAQQLDTYVRSGKRRVTARVRKETTNAGVKYYFTTKKKADQGAKDEHEVEITEDRYSRYLKRPIVLCDTPLTVRKKRVHFKGKFENQAVTVCLDRARGPGRIWLGSFVEVEIQVPRRRQIPATRRRLKRLIEAVLPPTARLERRGYRRMLLDVLDERCD